MITVNTATHRTTTPRIESNSPLSRIEVHLLPSSDGYEKLHGIVLHYTVPDTLLNGVSMELEGGLPFAALEHIFRECNHVDGTEWISKSGIRTRSLSCGDIVKLDGEYYLVEGCGWSKMSEANALHFIYHLNTRNWDLWWAEAKKSA